MMELKPVRDKACWPSREVFMLAYTTVLHTELPPYLATAGCEAGIEQKLIQSNSVTKIKN